MLKITQPRANVQSQTEYNGETGAGFDYSSTQD
jgi:hypothetical protein